VIRFEVKLKIAITYFDEVFGPQIVAIYPTSKLGVEKEVEDILRNLLDIVGVNPAKRKHFIFADESFVSQNVLISIYNSVARGNVTDFLISIIVQPNYSHIISALAFDWNPFFSLEDNLMPELEKFIADRSSVSIKPILKYLYDGTKSLLMDNVEILSPESYAFIDN